MLTSTIVRMAVMLQRRRDPTGNVFPRSQDEPVGSWGGSGALFGLPATPATGLLLARLPFAFMLVGYVGRTGVRLLDEDIDDTPVVGRDRLDQLDEFDDLADEWDVHRMITGLRAAQLNSLRGRTSWGGRPRTVPDPRLWVPDGAGPRSADNPVVRAAQRFGLSSEVYNGSRPVGWWLTDTLGRALGEPVEALVFDPALGRAGRRVGPTSVLPW
jgi:hypothetical protein